MSPKASPAHAHVRPESPCQPSAFVPKFRARRKTPCDAVRTAPDAAPRAALAARHGHGGCAPTFRRTRRAPPGAGAVDGPMRHPAALAGAVPAGLRRASARRRAARGRPARSPPTARTGVARAAMPSAAHAAGFASADRARLGAQPGLPRSPPMARRGRPLSTHAAPCAGSRPARCASRVAPPARARGRLGAHAACHCPGRRCGCGLVRKG